MEFQDVVRTRRMWRNFSDRPVPAEALERILGNAVRAPSAGFSQGWGFLVLTEPDDRATFWSNEWPGEEHGEMASGIMRAPVVVVPCSNKSTYIDRYAEPDKGWVDRDEARWPVPFWHIDTGFASLLMLLTAVDAGLGAVFIGLWQVGAHREAFGIPDDFTPIGAIGIGYAKEDIRSPSLKRGRRGVDQVVHRGRWQGPV